MVRKYSTLRNLIGIAAAVIAVTLSPIQSYAKAKDYIATHCTPQAIENLTWRLLGRAFAWVFEPLKKDALKHFAACADTAYQTQYRQEFIAGYEQHVSLLTETVTTEAVIKGNTAVFLVADSGSAEAVTRGVNGLIPARADNLTQNSCTLTEWHDLVRKTGFNVFASQGNQRAIMQMTSMGVINRKIDSQIITELATGTVTVGTTGTIPNVSVFQNGRVKLGNAEVPWDSNITLLCTAAFLAYLEQAPEFANAQYVDVRPYAGTNNPSWRDKPQAYRWRNCLIIEHPRLPGKGTTAEKSFMYHKTAIGHAADKSGLQTPVGYNDEQDYSWARASMNMGAKLLQNSGNVVFTTDGSAYA